MKIYLFYVQESNLNKEIQSTIIKKIRYEINGLSYLLYAYTNKKDFKDKFISQRKNFFRIVEKKVSKKKYESIKNELYFYRLDDYVYKNYMYSYPILSTGYEYNHCNKYWTDSVFNDKTFEYLSRDIIRMFKKDYYLAMFKLGLNHMVILGDESEESAFFEHEIEYDDDVSTIRLSSSHRDLHNVSVSFSLSAKEINLFLHVFKSLFKE